MFGVGPNENGNFCYEGKEVNEVVAGGRNGLERLLCFGRNNMFKCKSGKMGRGRNFVNIGERTEKQEEGIISGGLFLHS